MFKSRNLFFVFLILTNYVSIAGTTSYKKSLKEAKKQYKNKNFSEADSLLKIVLNLQPDNFDAIYLHGKTLFELRKFENSAEKYEQAIKLKPKEEGIYILLADNYLKLNNYQRAEITTSRYLELNSVDNSIVALQYRAFARLYLGKFMEAFNDCEKAIQQDSKNHLSWYYKALAADSLSSYEKARLDYEKAIYLLKNKYGTTINSTYKPYFLNLAKCYNKLKLYDNALETFQLILNKIDPQDKDEPHQYLVYYQRSNSFFGKMEYSTAISDLNKSIVLNNKFTNAFLLRAKIYYTTSQYQSAISDYTVVLNNIKSAELYSERGKSYFELMQYSNALADFQTALSINPELENIKEDIEKTNKKLYEVNKENQSPLIQLETPVVDDKGFININIETEETFLTGQVIDQSFINTIKINDKEIIFLRDKLNPKFSAKILNAKTNELEITAIDIYGNSKKEKFKIGKVLSESKLRYDFTGKLISDESGYKPIGNVLIFLLNKKGEKVASVYTDINGNFSFKSLPYDKNELTLMVDSTNEELKSIRKIIIADKNNTPILTTLKSKNNVFTFSILTYDPVTLSLMSVDDAPLNLNIKGKLINGDDMKTPLSYFTINLLNEKGEIIDKKKTDAYGFYLFSRIPRSIKYSIEIEENDQNKINCSKIVITDANGRIIKDFTKNKLNKFAFELLPNDQYYLSSIAEEDPWMRVFNLNENKKQLDIIENIYYESGASAILPEAEIILNKLISVMKSNPKINVEVESHTDALAGDDFNMQLSNERASKVLDYLKTAGIDKNRASGKGLGETKLINHCNNGVECSDAEHKQNRRTVFKLNYVK